MSQKDAQLPDQATATPQILASTPKISVSTKNAVARDPHSPYPSPSTIRVEDELIVIEIGNRCVRAGFAGDAAPRGLVPVGPANQRREGDFRQWHVPAKPSHQRPCRGTDWTREHELWQADLRGADLRLFEDRLERLLFIAFNRFLLVDSRGKKLCLVQNSSMPLPLLSSVLDVLFRRFHVPIVSMFSSAAMSVAAAGLRSGLVVDMGWSETVVTSIYEHREIRSTRSIRAGQRLVAATHDVMLASFSNDMPEQTPYHPTSLSNVDLNDSPPLRVIGLEECDEICRRLMWCRQSVDSRLGNPDPSNSGLAAVSEQYEGTEVTTHQGRGPLGKMDVPLLSTSPRRVVSISLDALANACEHVFVTPGHDSTYFDDDELPIHSLIYQHLLGLPVDVRAVCMSRIIFTGGCSNVLGLKGRIFDEVASVIRTRGWSQTTGKAFRPRNNHQTTAHLAPDGIEKTSPMPEDGEDEEDSVTSSHAEQEVDSIMQKIQRVQLTTPSIHGQLRSVESLGPWAGGSLMAHLKVMGLATIEREKWQQHGIAGASRPRDVDTKSQLRHGHGIVGSIGSSGLSRLWTLGAWGSSL